uniref:ATP synthase complex subunit 8 n=1 Tax=Phloeopora testacea TaxID=347434 RepID=A0A0S2M850_9COLE|nr:ATP synthase F0 subunit 8 [Phloeopora testacea]
MPQMAPMNWLMLFIYTIIIFLMFNILNYYSFFYMFKNMKIYNKTYKFNHKINWKW